MSSELSIVVVGGGPQAVTAVASLEAVVANGAARVTWICSSLTHELAPLRVCKSPAEAAASKIDASRSRFAVTELVCGEVIHVDSSAGVCVVDRGGDLHGGIDVVRFDLAFLAFGPMDMSHHAMLTSPRKHVGEFGVERAAGVTGIPEVSRIVVVDSAAAASAALHYAKGLKPVELPPTAEAIAIARAASAAAAAQRRKRELADASSDDDASASTLKKSNNLVAARPPRSRSNSTEISPKTEFRSPRVRISLSPLSADTQSFLRRYTECCQRAGCAPHWPLALCVVFPGQFVGPATYLEDSNLSSVQLGAFVDALGNDHYRLSAASRWSLSGNAAIDAAAFASFATLLFKPAFSPNIQPFDSFVTDLCLDCCVNIGVRGLDALSQTLSGGNQLKKLSLRHMGLEGASSGAVVLRLLQSSPKLQDLDLTGNPKLGDQCVIQVLQKGSELRLEKLALASCGVSDAIAPAIESWITHPHCKLQHIVLDGNLNIADAVAVAVAKLFAVGPAKSVSIMDCPLLSPSAARYVFESTAVTPSTKTLLPVLHGDDRHRVLMMGSGKLSIDEILPVASAIAYGNIRAFSLSLVPTASEVIASVLEEAVQHRQLDSARIGVSDDVVSFRSCPTLSSLAPSVQMPPPVDPHADGRGTVISEAVQFADFIRKELAHVNDATVEVQLGPSFVGEVPLTQEERTGLFAELLRWSSVDDGAVMHEDNTLSARDALSATEIAAAGIDLQLCFGDAIPRDLQTVKVAGRLPRGVRAWLDAAARVPGTFVPLWQHGAVINAADLCHLSRRVAADVCQAVHRFLSNCGAFSLPTANRIANDCAARMQVILRILALGYTASQVLSQYAHRLQWPTEVKADTIGNFAQLHALLSAVEVAVSSAVKASAVASPLWDTLQPEAVSALRAARDEAQRAKLAPPEPAAQAAAPAPAPAPTKPAAGGKAAPPRKTQDEAPPSPVSSPPRAKPVKDDTKAPTPEKPAQNFAATPHLLSAMGSSYAAWDHRGVAATALASGFARVHAEVYGPRQWAAL